MLENNTLISDFNKATGMQKILLVLILCCIIYFTLSNVVFYGATKKLEGLKRTQKEQQLSISSSRDLNQQIAEKEKELSKTASAQQSRFLTRESYPVLLSQLSTKPIADVKINNIRPGKEEKQDKYLTKELYINCDGTLSGLKDFLDGIKSVLLSSSITSLTITKRDDNYFTAEVFITSYLVSDKKSIPSSTQD